MKSSKNRVWNIGADTAGRSDFDFFVTIGDKYGIYFSSIEEYGMMKFSSPVQVWTDKDNPRLLFSPTDSRFEFQFEESCYYLAKSGIIVLLAPCSRGSALSLLYVLFDLNAVQFAIVNSPDFILTEIEKGVIRLDEHFRYAYDQKTKEDILKNNGRQVSLSGLKWYKMDELKRICLLTG